MVTSIENGADDEIVAVVVLPADTEAASVARELVDAHADHLQADLIEDAQLLVSEIVTNAVLHGRPDITLRIRLMPPSIGLAVTDAGDGVPLRPRRIPGASETSGRGLLIVNAVATAWGVTPNQPPPGKTVWFELGPS